MARLPQSPNQNPFEQLAPAESLDDSEPEDDVEQQEQEEWPVDDVEDEAPNGSIDEAQRIARDGSQEAHILRKLKASDDAVSINSLSTGIVDSSRANKAPLAGNRSLPPIPDLRFEQGYLKSIRDAKTWKRVVWITIRDQVLLPLVQGTLWTLAQVGFRFWNRGTLSRGAGMGRRIRSWLHTNVFSAILPSR